MSDTQETPNLSLFQIDESLLMLLEAREEIGDALRGERDPEVIEERNRELAEVERLLTEYRAQLPAKVDRIRGLLLHAQTAAETHRAEAARQLALARQWESREAQVKEMVAEVIERIPDRKRLPGSMGYLLLKRNGGVQPLIVSNPEQVPEDCCRYVGWIGGALWQKMREAFPWLGDPFETIWSDFSIERTIDNERVRRAMNASCLTCGGKGFTAADGSIDNAFQGADSAPKPKCSACGGTGKSGVPGAHLGERGRHVEVK